MSIIELPFNELIGLTFSQDPAYLLSLKRDLKYTNHLGTVHAAALYALAEATCGQFLLLNFPEFKNNLIPVVRTAEVKYKKPAMGQIHSTAILLETSIENLKIQLKDKNRALIKLKVDLFDETKLNVMSSTFDWFISQAPAS